MNSKRTFLQDVDDGLPCRISQPYAKYKLQAVKIYLQVANIAMRNLQWCERYYIDLFSGPGKNRINDEVLLGSPLIALTAPYGFTRFRLNEPSEELNQALDTRCQASRFYDRVKIDNGDANVVVDSICNEITSREKSKSADEWNSFNIAFLDPEGLELRWSTVEKLARMKKMDLIILFSTMGLTRNIAANNHKIINDFFGTSDWKQVVAQTSDTTQQRRKLIDFYMKRLKSFGYEVYDDPDTIKGTDIPFKNSRNSQQYSLIFASKHELGYKFWDETSKRHNPQARLPGFE